MKQKVLGGTNCLLSFDTTRTARVQNYSILACAFTAAVTLLQIRCLATTEGYTYRDTD
jgi:hypothetical protein